MGLFCDFYRLGQEEGRLIALQIIFDLVLLFGLKYFESEVSPEEDPENETENPDNANNLQVMGVISTALYDPDEKIQNTSAEGFAKLFLNRVVDDKAVLEGLFHLYLHPSTDSSSPIKQCLSYFFQAYAFISPQNQLTIGSSIGKILGSWIRISRQSNVNTVTLSSVASQLLYLVERGNLIQNTNSRSNLELYNEMYAQIAVDLSWVILNDPLDDSSKILSNIICKLPLKSLPNSSLLKQLLFLQTQIMKYLQDKTTINTLKRFTANLLQIDTQETPLDFEVINEMRAQMQKIIPSGLKINSAASNSLTQNVKKVKIAVDDISGNIMDDISDLLEDDE